MIKNTFAQMFIATNVYFLLVVRNTSGSSYFFIFKIDMTNF